MRTVREPGAAIFSVRRLAVAAVAAAVLVAPSLVQLTTNPVIPISSTGEAATIDQCTNGMVSPFTPQPCVGSNAAAVTTSAIPGVNGGVAGTYKNWVNGNSNGSKSHWREGEFISYRTILTGLTAGDHTVVIHYDSVHSGGHAIDYLGSYDATEKTDTAPTTIGAPPIVIHANNSSPCADLVNATQFVGETCNPAAPASSTATPAADFSNHNTGGHTGETNCGTAGGVFTGAQAPGLFKLYGPGTLAAASYVSQNVVSGTGQCTTTVSIPFHSSALAANQSLVIAWGGHIASELEWGRGNSATAISGSPYHMALDSLDGASTGSQDRALSTSAIFFTPGITTAIKTGASGSDSGPAVTSVTAGTLVHDTATFTGLFSAGIGGAVTYNRYSGTTCGVGSGTLLGSQVVTAANGVIPDSTAVTVNSSISYQAVYAGDGNGVRRHHRAMPEPADQQDGGCGHGERGHGHRFHDHGVELGAGYGHGGDVERSAAGW